MFGNDKECIMLSKVADFAVTGRGNRFPVGRNRVPSVQISKLGIFVRGNRFPVGRNRVPHTKFQGELILKNWEPGSPSEEPVTTVYFSKTSKTS